jgi:hypothetical protein
MLVNIKADADLVNGGRGPKVRSQRSEVRSQRGGIFHFPFLIFHLPCSAVVNPEVAGVSLKSSASRARSKKVHSGNSGKMENEK